MSHTQRRIVFIVSADRYILELSKTLYTMVDQLILINFTAFNIFKILNAAKSSYSLKICYGN